MKINLKHFRNIQSLSEYHDVDFKHPLISIIKYEEVRSKKLIKNEPLSFDFYTISFVKNFNGFIQIGNTKFKGKNGVLHFIEPKQRYTCNSTNPWKGYQVLIHPRIFKHNFAHKEIDTYDFFSYEVNESLLLTGEEEKLVEDLLGMAWREFSQENDDFSISIILSFVSTLLSFTDRFYARQFKNRKILNNQLTNEFLDLLKDYYSPKTEVEIHKPTVQYFASKLKVTPNYLSNTVRYHTGKAALNHVHDFVIEEAKKQLKLTNKTVSEISFELGFEYPNYFSRLFKKRTQQTPSGFRKSVKSI